MKLIKTDNFDRDYIPDTLIAGHIPNTYWAEKLATMLNDLAGTSSPDYFRAVTDDYVLKEFEP